jgi:hypothetical protein
MEQREAEQVVLDAVRRKWLMPVRLEAVERLPAQRKVFHLRGWWLFRIDDGFEEGAGRPYVAVDPKTREVRFLGVLR